MSVFVMVCETRPLPVYPIVFRHPGLPVGRKRCVFHFIHRHVRPFLLVSLIWQPARASSLRRRGWWKKRLQYFEFGLQYLVQPLGVNPTYSTFKQDVLDEQIANSFSSVEPNRVIWWRGHVGLCTDVSIVVVFWTHCLSGHLVWSGERWASRKRKRWRLTH